LKETRGEWIYTGVCSLEIHIHLQQTNEWRFSALVDSMTTSDDYYTVLLHPQGQISVSILV
jgi:hypothetical protein